MLLFVDNLTNSDFSYLHPNRGLLGETWLSHIELEGELDQQGMVCDFGIVKSSTRQLLDDLIDHRLLVPKKAAGLEVAEQGRELFLRWELADGRKIEHRSPAQCVTLIDAGEITPDTVARWCELQLQQQLPGDYASVRLRFSTEAIEGPYYHYSHGLKKHAGKCQRIAHGHRSRIQILRDGEPAPDLERQWAKILADSFVGTREDLHEEPGDYCRFSYHAEEGEFSLLLPSSQCYLLDSDSTVEHIARHIAESLKQQEPSNHHTVKAYEGLGKGAVVSR